MALTGERKDKGKGGVARGPLAQLTLRLPNAAAGQAGNWQLESWLCVLFHKQGATSHTRASHSRYLKSTKVAELLNQAGLRSGDQRSKGTRISI